MMSGGNANFSIEKDKVISKKEPCISQIDFAGKKVTMIRHNNVTQIMDGKTELFKGGAKAFGKWFRKNNVVRPYRSRKELSKQK